MMMVKSNAYGVGDITLCQHLPRWGVSIAGIANVQEAIRLREAGITMDLFVFHASCEQIPALLSTGASVGVSDQLFVQELEKSCQKEQKIARVHLHLDTGMTRFGTTKEQALALAQTITSSPYLHLEGVMSHLACADQPWNDSVSHSQINSFSNFIQEIQKRSFTPPKWIHLANSAGAQRLHIPFCNLIRLGIEAYGIRPSSAYPKTNTELALQLSSTILSISEHSKGTGVSYGHQDILERNTRVGVIPLGYFDGLHRKYKKGSLLCRGKKVPIIGNITMDYTMIDLTETDAEVGDQVIIFGYDQEGNFSDPIALAEECGTIPHELITCLGPRIPREYTVN